MSLILLPIRTNFLFSCKYERYMYLAEIYYRVIRFTFCLSYLSILINLELIDLSLKGDFLWPCFCSKSYQIILKFSAKFCCTLPQLQASKEQKIHGSKVKFICTLISIPLKPSMETPIDLIAFEHNLFWSLF